MSQISSALIAAHLLACEQMLLDPVVRRDRARVSALLADDFVEFGASGRVWTRGEVLDLLEKENYVKSAIEDLTCRQLADGVVIVTYRSARTNENTGEGTVSLRSSIWSKESGEPGEAGKPERWLLRFHQGTKLP